MGSSASKVVRPPGRDPWAACQAGDLSTLSQWLDEGGQPDAVDSANGRGSLLHAAAAAEQAACVELLLKSGANVDLEVQSMGTPLHAAAACGATATILMLLHYGANPEALFRGRTPAELAQLSGSSATANLIRMHMVGNVPGPFDAHDDETLAPSGGGSVHSSLDSSSSGNAALDDPLLAFVWRVMLKRPPPERRTTQPMHPSHRLAAGDTPLLDRFKLSQAQQRLASGTAETADASGAAVGTAAQSAAEPELQAAAAPWWQVAATEPHEAPINFVSSSAALAVAAGPSPPQQPLGQAGPPASVPTKPSMGGAPSRPTIDIRPWEISFEDLTLQMIIGEGSFGKVYKAKFHEMPVAVKVLWDVSTTPSEQVDKLLTNLCKECRVMASLRHPCVVQYMGICTSPPAIVSEFCSRGSLYNVLTAAKASPDKMTQLGWKRRLNMALDGAKGMLYLHKRGMVHTVLKSTNLLVDANWRVKVADFSMFKIADVGSASINPRWLAPEVVNGEAATPASDVFSWGMVMWELLTLELPWHGLGPWTIVGKVMSGERLEVPPREQLPGLDTDIFAGLDDYVALMRRCWAQQPEDRPSFEDVINELRRMLEAHLRLPEVQARMLEAQASKGDQQPAEQQLSAEPPSIAVAPAAAAAAMAAPAAAAPAAPAAAPAAAAEAAAAAPIAEPSTPSAAGQSSTELQQAVAGQIAQASAGPAGDAGRPAPPPASGSSAGGGTGPVAGGSGIGRPGPPAVPGPGSPHPRFSGTERPAAGVPAGAAGGGGSPQPGSPQPGSPQTPSRRTQHGSGARTLLQTLCFCSSEVTPAPARAQGGGDSLPADLREWIMRFEDLEMQLVIGEGSYGKVYKAKLHETLVAVKVLLDYDMALQAAHRNALHTITDPIAASLQQECGLMARLRHPNIVQFMGVSTCPPAMVTEFCSRGSLYDVLKAARVSSPRQPPLTWPRRLSMALDAAKGMLYLHMRGIIHRDLKSPNLLVEATWRVKVADFNLSKILGTDSSGPEVPLKRRRGCCWPSSAGQQKEAASVSSAGSGCATPSPIVSGTMSNLNPRWLAPEVMNGQAATPASDVFSWGVVMWELLTLKVPWEGIDRWPLLTKRMGGMRLEVPPREQLPGPDTPSFGGLDDYIALMQRCLAQSLEQRPGFEEVIRELRKLLEAQAKTASR